LQHRSSVIPRNTTTLTSRGINDLAEVIGILSSAAVAADEFRVEPILECGQRSQEFLLRLDWLAKHLLHAGQGFARQREYRCHGVVLCPDGPYHVRRLLQRDHSLGEALAGLKE